MSTATNWDATEFFRTKLQDNGNVGYRHIDRGVILYLLELFGAVGHGVGV